MAVATHNVRTLTIRGNHGYIQLGCNLIGLQEIQASGSTTLSAAGYRVSCSGQETTATRQGLHGVGPALQESLCGKSVYYHQFVDKRQIYMRFDLASKCDAVNFVAAYALIDCTKDAELRRILWQKLEDLVEKIPTKECLFVRMDAKARPGQRKEGRGGDKRRALGEYGRDVLLTVLKNTIRKIHRRFRSSMLNRDSGVGYWDVGVTCTPPIPLVRCSSI